MLDALLMPHKLHNYMYQSKKLLKGLAMTYHKIDVYQNNCMLF